MTTDEKARELLAELKKAGVKNFSSPSGIPMLEPVPEFSVFMRWAKSSRAVQRKIVEFARAET